VSKLIKTIAPHASIKGNSTPPRSGAFEITLNDNLVYSKFKTGEFPQESEIKSWF
jgi:selT/selW/selH-like putative selenoprotein